MAPPRLSSVPVLAGCPELRATPWHWPHWLRAEVVTGHHHHHCWVALQQQHPLQLPSLPSPARAQLWSQPWARQGLSETTESTSGCTTSASQQASDNARSQEASEWEIPHVGTRAHVCLYLYCRSLLWKKLLIIRFLKEKCKTREIMLLKQGSLCSLKLGWWPRDSNLHPATARLLSAQKHRALKSGHLAFPIFTAVATISQQAPVWHCPVSLRPLPLPGAQKEALVG